MSPTAVLRKKYFTLHAFAFKRQTLVLLAILAFSLTVRYHEYSTFREFTSDKSRQLDGAYQLLQGKGVSLESHDLATFQPALQPLVEWPPAYSYFVASISYVSGLEIYPASVVLDVICLTALWVIFFWLTNLLGFTLLQRLLLFILLAFAKTLFIKLYSADLLAATLFLYAAAASLFIVQRKAEGRVSAFVYASLFAAVFFMIFLKYSLWPAPFAIGLSLLTYSRASGKKFYRFGGYLLIACVVSVALLVLYNQFRTGHSNGLYNRHPNKVSRLYFENLVLFDPFIVNAFFFLDIFFTRFSFYVINGIAQTVSFIIFIWMTWNIGGKIKKGEAGYFSHLVLITAFCSIGFLTALSLYFPKDAYGTFEWTYVNEFRYFAPAVFLIIFYLLKNFSLRLPPDKTRFAISVFAGSGIAATAVSGLYYQISHNTAGSFDNLYGKIFRVNEFVEKRKNNKTYFVSLSNHKPTDSETTSLVAISGTKVAVSYYGYFPDSVYSILFSKTRQVPADKKIIVFLDKNVRLLDSINLRNHHTVEENGYGEKFLVIN